MLFVLDLLLGASKSRAGKLAEILKKGKREDPKNKSKGNSGKLDEVTIY